MSNAVDNLSNFGIRVTAEDLKAIKKMIFLPNDAGKKMRATVKNLFLLGSIEADKKPLFNVKGVAISLEYKRAAEELEQAHILSLMSQRDEKNRQVDYCVINRDFISDVKNLVKAAHAQEKADAKYWEKMAREFQGLYQDQVAETGHAQWLLRAALDELRYAGVKAASKARITAQATKKKFKEAAEHFSNLYSKNPSDVTLDDITKFKEIKTRR